MNLATSNKPRLEAHAIKRLSRVIMGEPHRFKKGISGNPSGRPKALVDVQLIVRGRTKECIETMIHWMRQRADPTISLRAAIALHEIAWGKPSQAITGADGGPQELIIKWLDSPQPVQGMTIDLVQPQPTSEPSEAIALALPPT